MVSFLVWFLVLLALQVGTLTRRPPKGFRSRSLVLADLFRERLAGVAEVVVGLPELQLICEAVRNDIVEALSHLGQGYVVTALGEALTEGRFGKLAPLVQVMRFDFLAHWFVWLRGWLIQCGIGSGWALGRSPSQPPIRWMATRIVETPMTKM